MLFLILRVLFFLGNICSLFIPNTAQLVNSWWGFIPVLFLFASFASGILGWGLVLEKKFGGGGGGVYLLSSLAAVGFAMVAGHLGLLGPGHRWIFILFLNLGIYLAPQDGLAKQILWFKNPWLNGIFVFTFGLRAFSAFLPQGHGDPLLYHLMAPRLWNLQGIVKLNQDLPVPLLASTWEYFYLWPQVLFTSAAASVSELVLAQIFSQWIHLIWGLYGSIWILNELIDRKKLQLPETHRAILMLALLFVYSMQWTGALAKNDCGVAFWCLGAWLYLGDFKFKSWILAGIFAGLAVAGKISAILFLIPLAIFAFFQLVYFKWKKQLDWSLFGQLLVGSVLGVILGAGPVYLRNWIETHNPFYTMFAHIFPSYWISQSWADHFSTHQPSEEANHLEIFIYRVRQLLAEAPGYWLWIFAPIAMYFRRPKLAKVWDWYLLFALSILVCVFAVQKNAEVRYLGAALWLGSLLGLYFCLSLLDLLPKKFERGIVVFLFVGLMATSKLPTHFLWKFFKSTPGEAHVLEHSGGSAKAWLRENIKNNNLVVIYGDNETYYLSTIRTTILTERPDIDKATYGLKELPAFLKGLCQTSGAKYLLDARDGSAIKLRFPDTAWDRALLFEGDGARVYDLVKLQSLVLKNNFGCGKN